MKLGQKTWENKFEKLLKGHPNDVLIMPSKKKQRRFWIRSCRKFYLLSEEMKLYRFQIYFQMSESFYGLMCVSFVKPCLVLTDTMSLSVIIVVVFVVVGHRRHSHSAQPL